MANYNITSLNYMASGSNRGFLNMDVEIDLDENRLRDYVHLLAREQKDKDQPVLSGDIIFERREAFGGESDYIAYDFNSTSLLSDDYQASAVANAIARNEKATGLILDETRAKYLDGLDGDGKIRYMQLVLSCCSDSERAKLREFLNTVSTPGKIYEFEFNQENQLYNCLEISGHTQYPLYDMYDVCVKSKNRIFNNRLRNFDVQRPSKTEDVYIPQSAKSVAFAQIGQNAYLLTSKTKDGLDRLSSTLHYGILNDGYKMELRHQHMKTYLYPSVSELSGMSAADSYRQSLNVFQTDAAAELFGTRSSDNFFSPRVNLDGVEYNYVVQAPVSDVKSEYRNGNVYGDIYHTKNMYNALYSMQMSSQFSIEGCRDYTDIIECGGQLYLKFDDNISYSGNGKDFDYCMSSLNSTMNVPVDGRPGGYSYQKIETFNPAKAGVANKHKSTFFSINLADVVDLDVSEADSLSVAKYKQNIKFDIVSSIKEIVKNVCPANTQLFDVYFGRNQ